MYQGTTPFILIEMPEDLTGNTIQIAFQPVAGEMFLKGTKDITIYRNDSGCILTVAFTQEETFQIPEGPCRVEMRWVDEDGIADKADLGYIDVIGSMTKNVLTYQGGTEA